MVPTQAAGVRRQRDLILSFVHYAVSGASAEAAPLHSLVVGMVGVRHQQADLAQVLGVRPQLTSYPL